MTEQQPGEYLEERLIGMLLISPARLKETLELKAEDFASSLNWRVLQAIRELGNDIHAIVETMRGGRQFWCVSAGSVMGLGEYLVHLAANESFCPENIPAYVRAIREAAGQREYKASVGKLADKRETKLFGSV